MTDEVYIEANNNISSSNDIYNAQVRMRCYDNGKLTYRITTFRDDESQAIDSEPSLMGLAMGIPTNRVEYQVRLDGNPPEIWFYIPAKYNNAIYVRDNDDRVGGKTESSLFASRMSEAQKVTIKLQMNNGEGIFEINQTDAGLRQLLSECSPNTPNRTAHNVDSLNRAGFAGGHWL